MRYDIDVQWQELEVYQIKLRNENSTVKIVLDLDKMQHLFP